MIGLKNSSGNGSLAQIKVFKGLLTYNGSYFPCDLGTTGQITIMARNMSNGSILTLWYNKDVKGFQIDSQTGTTSTDNAVCASFVY